MRFLLRSGVLEDIQKDLELNDQEFAEYIGVSRSQLWRAKMPPEDKRFSLGQDFMAKVLNKLNKTFDEIFFLEESSHECDKMPAEKEAI